VSNVSLEHLEQMKSMQSELPAFVQNRCYASLGWDRAIRGFCRDHSITYQGFSLLTANVDVVRSSAVANLAAQHNATLPQIIFAFARAVGILPLTGTSSREHMRQDLDSSAVELPPAAVKAIEAIAG
jgi:diketogulonate reductase-like aldo/keto reductase